MKKLFQNLSSITSRVCMAGLALLGFGCSESGDVPCMYGTPTADFEVKGKVADNDGNPVNDAVIRVTYPDDLSEIHSVGADTTGVSGAYAVGGIIIGSPENRIKVVCVPQDDSFEPDSTVVALKKVKDGDKEWYQGKGDATVNFSLTKKDAE